MNIAHVLSALQKVEEKSCGRTANHVARAGHNITIIVG